MPTDSHRKPNYTIGDVTISVDAEKVGELKGVKVAGQYSAMTGYGLLIGRNTDTPVSHKYQVPFPFTRAIQKVVIQTK
jgi:hypothetical protein